MLSSHKFLGNANGAGPGTRFSSCRVSSCNLVIMLLHRLGIVLVTL